MCLGGSLEPMLPSMICLGSSQTDGLKEYVEWQHTYALQDVNGCETNLFMKGKADMSGPL